VAPDSKRPIEEAVRRFLDRFVAEASDTSARVVEEIPLFGDAAVTPLLGLVLGQGKAGELRPELLRKVCEALVVCGPRGVAGLEEVVQGDSADPIRAEALAALRLGGGELDGTFAKALRSERRAAVREVAVRRCAADPAFRPLLTERARLDRARSVRLASCEAIVRERVYRPSGAPRPEINAHLLKIGFDGRHADARICALQHIGTLGKDPEPSEPAIQLLDTATDDPDPEVREAARMVLRRSDVDEPPTSRSLMVATIASAWEGRYDRVVRRIDVLRSLHFRRTSLDSRYFGREAGTDLAVSLLPMLLSRVEEERRSATWFLLDVCLGIHVPTDWREAILNRMAALAAEDEQPPWTPRDVRDLFLAHANRDPRAERALHVLLGLFDGWAEAPTADFLTSWRWTLADSPRPTGWMVVAGAVVHAEQREELGGPTRAFLREVASGRPDLAGVARLGLAALASEEPVPEYDPVDVRHGLADAGPAERAERLFRWGRGLPGRDLTRRQWTTVAGAITPGAAGDRILSQLGRLRSRADALRLLRHAERIAARSRRNSGPGRPRSSELMREYREWVDDDLDWEAWVQREREEAFQEQLVEQRSYSWADPASRRARDHANLGQRLLSLPRRHRLADEDTRLRDVPGAHEFLRDWRKNPEWEPRLPDDPELEPIVRRLFGKPVDEPLTLAAEIEALAWLEAEGEPTPWEVGGGVIDDLLEAMASAPRSEAQQRRIYDVVVNRVGELSEPVAEWILKSLHRMHPEWIPLAQHLAAASLPNFRQAIDATHGSALALEIARLSDVDRFDEGLRESWEQVVDAARQALADQEPDDEDDEFDPEEHLDAPLEEWQQDFADQTSLSAERLLWAGAGTLWGTNYPEFELVSRASVSTVHPEVAEQAVALCDELRTLFQALEESLREDPITRIAPLFDRPGEVEPPEDPVVIGDVGKLLMPFVERLDDGRALVDDGAAVPAVGVLTAWPDEAEVLAEIGRHVIAYVSLRREVLPRDVRRIRVRHIRRFWSRVDELEFRPPRTCAGAVTRWGLDSVLEGLAHALLHQAQQRRQEPREAHAFRREMWHYCVRLVALVRGSRLPASLRLDWLREFGNVGCVTGDHGESVDVDGQARLLLDHLAQRVLGGPGELCQALGLPVGALPRLSGGKLMHLERRYGALRRRLSLPQDGGGQDEGLRYQCRPLPKALALMRGALGGDCSSATVPLRALLPHYTYYGVFQDGNQQRGYMTLVEAWARSPEGEMSRVLCLETINVPIRAFDSVQQDLLLIFESIARSRGLDGLVMIHDASTWNYSNEEAIRHSRRVADGLPASIEPADPAVFSAYELLAPGEAGTYCPFRAGQDYTLLDAFDPVVDRVQPENRAEAARLAALGPGTPVETCWAGGTAVGFISAWPRPDPE